jgi:chromosome segregation ATPase
MDGKEKPVTEIQQQLMLWVEQTKRLLVSLPAYLSELEQLKGEAGRYHEAMSELERENQELRRSRDDLTTRFGKLKELIAGPGDETAQKVVDAPSPVSTATLDPSAFQASKVRLFSGLRQPADKPHN